jgi:hypothetical protein
MHFDHSVLKKPRRSDKLRSILESGLLNRYSFEHIIHALESIVSFGASWEDENSRAGFIDGLLTAGPVWMLRQCFDERWAEIAAHTAASDVRAGIDRTASAAKNSEEWKTFGTVFGQLLKVFDASFFTTNYDTLLEDALGFGPADEGFGPICTAQGNRSFNAHSVPRLRMMHLHGSLRMCRDTGGPPPRLEGDFYKMYWNERIETTLYGRSMYADRPSQTGRRIYVGPVVSGLDKTSKLVTEPYLTYNTMLYRSLSESPLLLIVGYAFGDLHINAAIEMHARVHGTRRRVVVIDKVVPDGDGIQRVGDGSGTVEKHLNDLSFDMTLADKSKQDGMGTSADGTHMVYWTGLLDVMKSRWGDVTSFLLSGM